MINLNWGTMAALGDTEIIEACCASMIATYLILMFTLTLLMQSCVYRVDGNECTYFFHSTTTWVSTILNTAEFNDILPDNDKTIAIINTASHWR